MKLATTIFVLIWFQVLSAAELGEINERVTALKLRVSATEGMALNRDKLLSICEGLEGARWCEGYLAAILAALDIPRNADCLPATDMAPFMYGNIWELTQNWLYDQPEILEITLYDAILNALTEQESCSI